MLTTHTTSYKYKSAVTLLNLKPYTPYSRDVAQQLQFTVKDQKTAKKSLLTVLPLTFASKA